MAKNKIILYTDLTSDFRKTLKNDIGLLINTSAINNSIIKILSTRKGDSPLDPLFGCDLSDLLFENLDGATVLIIKESILTALKTYEPRITNISITAEDQPDLNTLIITLTYDIKTSSESGSLTFKLFG